MTDPTKMERLFVWRCPECGEYWTCDGESPEEDPAKTPRCCGYRRACGAEYERIEVIPAQEVERLEQALGELEDAVEQIASLTHQDTDPMKWGKEAGKVHHIARAALSQARDLLGDG